MPAVLSTLIPQRRTKGPDSTPAPNAERGRPSSTQHNVGEENDHPVRHPTVTRPPLKKATHARINSDDEDEDDDANRPGADGEHIGDDEDDDDDAASPVRGRTRRASEKQSQLYDEQREAEARRRAKAEKAAKAARKKAGVVEEDTRGPIDDDHFTERTIPSTRPTATKNLAQRSSKVPPTPVFPHPDWRPIPNTSSAHRRDRDSGRDDAALYSRSHRTSSLSAFRARSPAAPAREPLRNINGGLVPDAMTLQLYNYAPVPPPQASSRPRSRSPPRVPPHPRSRSRSRSPLRAPPRRRSRSPPRAPPRPRSASPNAGDKRPRSSSLDSDDLRSTQSPRTTGSNGRPRAKDLDDRTREYAVLAMDLYRCYLSTENAFPDSAEENTMIRQSWRTTCEEMGENMILTPAVAKLIASRGSRLRGELKTKIRPLVDAMYRFESGQNRKTTAANRKLAEDLKEGTSYAFKDCENKKGLYKHPIIQSAVNSMWFANRRDEGPRHPELFNPLRLRSLAVVLTAVENNIDERLTGVRTDVPFTANDYRAVYEAHIKALEDFNVHTGKYALLEKILKRLHNVGRFHSGAQSLQAPPTSTFSKSILDAALKEYEEGATTDDSSETEF